MNSHLSREQIADLVIGGGAPDAAHHCAECSSCGAEVARLREAICLFGTSTRLWSRRLQGPDGPGWIVPADTPLRRTRRLRWALTTAALGIIALVPGYKIVKDQQLKIQAIEDQALLEDINARLSRSVPAALEPMIHLLAAGSGEVSPQTNGGRQ